MAHGERARRLLNAIWRSMVVLVMLVGSAGLLAGKHDSPILAAILLIMAGIASSAYACECAMESIMAKRSIKSKASAPTTRPGRGMRALGSVLVCWEAMFIVGPLIIAVVAFWHAIRALRQ